MDDKAWATVIEDQEFSLIKKLEHDLFNGGFLEFFAHGGQNFEETLKMLDKIGAQKTIGLLTEGQKTVFKFKDKNPSLWEITQNLTDIERKKLENLDEQLLQGFDEVVRTGIWYYYSEGR